jgi:hypothetical protein
MSRSEVETWKRPLMPNPRTVWVEEGEIKAAQKECAGGVIQVYLRMKTRRCQREYEKELAT